MSPFYPFMGRGRGSGCPKGTMSRFCVGLFSAGRLSQPHTREALIRPPNYPREESKVQMEMMLSVRPSVRLSPFVISVYVASAHDATLYDASE